MNQWLEQELETAKEAHDQSVTESGFDSRRSQYWFGYWDAIANTMNQLSGMSEE